MNNPLSQEANNGRQAPLLATLEGLLSIHTLDLQRGLTEASNVIAQALQAEKVDVFLYEEQSDTLVAVGTSETPLGKLQHKLGLHRMPLANGGSAATVFQTGTAYRSGHVDQDMNELRGIRVDLAIKSALTVPLDVEGTRRGIIQVDSVHQEHFSSDDLIFLTAAAHWVGMVYQRAEMTERLTQEVNERARQVMADELIAILAHDLRAPLTPVRGYITMLLDEAEREEHSHYMTLARGALRGTDRLLHMIEDLLDATRLKQGIFTVRPDVIELTVLLREIVEMHQTEAHPLTVQAAREWLVECEPERIRQVLENLISNAQHYTPAGTPITIDVECEHVGQEAWAVVTVRDTGPGIPPAMLQNLFSQYVQGRSKTGLGLGLYLAHGIAKAHKGTLSVDSVVGKGTTFRLALPVSPDMC